MATYITIFGSTGDLMYSKLIPALAALKRKNHLDDSTTVLCIGRRDWTHSHYIDVAEKKVKDAADVATLADNLEYVKLDIGETAHYEALSERIHRQKDNPEKIFYLAVPPSLFPTIAANIAKSGLMGPGQENSRLVFEKPFGEDLSSARKINVYLRNHFDETQIYRIDHYLGKEMIQNIMMMRFANKIFESDWHKDSVESVCIIAKEDSTVGTRGAYYDNIGALKDMVQSHLFQMLALVAMEEPRDFSPESLHEEKVSLMRKISIAKEGLVLGQYEGYKEEDGVKPGSKTETFVHLKVSIDDSRWRDVPFYLMTGKKLDEKRSAIIIDFKKPVGSQNLWPSIDVPQNQLIIQIAPKEGVSFRMNVKKAGLTDELETRQMDYVHAREALGNIPEAYERLFHEIIKKNQLLFTRWDEIETAWGLIDQIRHHAPAEPVSYRDYEAIRKGIEETHKEVRKK